MPALSLPASQYSHPTGFADFRSYLRTSSHDPFVLNLRDATLMEVVEACIKAKSKRHPCYRSTTACLVHNLNQLEKDYGVTLKPIQITDIFWGYFISFCQERNLRLSTISTLCDELRAVLNWAVKYNATVSPTYTDIGVPRVRNIQVALTADEISRITYFDVQRFYKKRRADFKDTMERVRDMFVLSANLGQRHSDCVRIEPSCFDRNVFRITQQKTGNLAVVNIDKFSIDAKTTYRLLEKYGYRAPYAGTIGNYNNYLHMLFRDIGLDDVIRVEERVNGKLVTKNVPKWKMCASHTARRSFVTINVLRGKNIISLKKCTGHTDTRCFENYVRDE